jgi:hypothetical protein
MLGVERFKNSKALPLRRHYKAAEPRSLQSEISPSQTLAGGVKGSTVRSPFYSWKGTEYGRLISHNRIFLSS